MSDYRTEADYNLAASRAIEAEQRVAEQEPRPGQRAYEAVTALAEGTAVDTERLRPCGCLVDDPGCPYEHDAYNARYYALAADSNVTHHEDAGCDLEELPYDPDLGDNEWRCRTHGITVRVPGW